jgi:hypothetical protein
MRAYRHVLSAGQAFKKSMAFAFARVIGYAQSPQDQVLP